jgi:hypothetical protein
MATRSRRHVTVAPPRYPHLRPPRQVPVSARSEVEVKLESDAAFTWTPGSCRAPLQQFDPVLGAATQLGRGPVTHELMLGIDFGTSSTKVVITDRTQLPVQSIAVPYCQGTGLDRFLLPSRLYESDEGFSLKSGGRSHANLKLALLNEPDVETAQINVTAYLALAIRSARAWLYTERAQLYRHVNLLWGVCLGVPSERISDSLLSKTYELLGRAAWSLAALEGAIDRVTTRKALAAARSGASVDDSLDIRAVPEVVAQMYGFVQSSQFATARQRHFLLIDVGAGTVDAIVFGLNRGADGIVHIEPIMAKVRATGTMNLHRHRMVWWRQHLQDAGAHQRWAREIKAAELSTDEMAAIPQTYLGYWRGVKVELRGGAKCADDEFRKSVRQQFQGVLYRCKDYFGTTDVHLQGLPLFLCGGGSRMQYYGQLGDELRKIDGFKWMSAVRQPLVKPRNLLAPGLGQADFDRLSVAYGLSAVDYGGVRQPPPPVRRQIRRRPGNEPPSKDQV